MASSLLALHNAVVAALQGATGIETVEDHPAKVEDWLAGLRGRPLPSVHVAAESELAPHTVDGEYAETTAWTLVTVFPQIGSTVSQYTVLRDALVAALETDYTFGGLCDVSGVTGSKLTAQESEFQQFALTFTATQYWTP